MEQWELDFHWLRLRHFIRDTFRTPELPEMEAILFLIGIQELGIIQKKFRKEQKMQLMHDAACLLLSKDGYFQLNGRNEKGWPEWVEGKKMDMDENDRTRRLQQRIIEYFEPFVSDENQASR